MLAKRILFRLSPLAVSLFFLVALFPGIGIASAHTVAKSVPTPCYDHGCDGNQVTGACKSTLLKSAPMIDPITQGTVATIELRSCNDGSDTVYGTVYCNTQSFHWADVETWDSIDYHVENDNLNCGGHNGTWMNGPELGRDPHGFFAYGDAYWQDHENGMVNSLSGNYNY